MHNVSTPTVVVGMSGGVDSSVSALLLKQQGYHVIGIFMKNWEDEDDEGTCRSSLDFHDVRQVCEQIDIPYYTVNFVKEYSDQVFQHFLADLQDGLTPNPDVLCNQEIKFKIFLEKALNLGAQFLATGHYAQCIQDKQTHSYLLKKGADENKDQSYFLYTLDQTILPHVLFPVGNMEKGEVRRIAREHRLTTSDKKDSTGICFIGERKFTQFLMQHIRSEPGEFQTLDGQVVGKHKGTPFYTLGQRKGLGIGGSGEAWFVVKKDVPRNIVFVAQGADHPALYCHELWAKQLTWVSGSPPSLPFTCQSKVRYRQADQPCRLESLEDGTLYVTFPEPQRAVTPGQSLVLYDGDVC